MGVGGCQRVGRSVWVLCGGDSGGKDAA
jgi:hypothetical protein